MAGVREQVVVRAREHRGDRRLVTAVALVGCGVMLAAAPPGAGDGLKGMGLALGAVGLVAAGFAVYWTVGQRRRRIELDHDRFRYYDWLGRLRFDEPGGVHRVAERYVYGAEGGRPPRLVRELVHVVDFRSGAGPVALWEKRWTPFGLGVAWREVGIHPTTPSGTGTLRELHRQHPGLRAPFRARHPWRWLGLYIAAIVAVPVLVIAVAAGVVFGAG